MTSDTSGNGGDTSATPAGRAPGAARVGAWSIMGHRVGVEAMCRLGFDFLGVDSQHGFFSFDGASVLIQVANLCAIPCLVRVPAGHLDWIPRYLDAGADGIVVAMVETAEEARRAVQLARYQPAGQRSYGGGKRNGVGDPAGAGPVGSPPEVFAMVETAAAARDIEGICSIEGLNGVWIGPTDLALALGGQYPLVDDQSWLATLDEVVATCEAHGKRSGMFAADGDDARHWLQRGFKDVVLSSDIALLRRALHEHLELARRPVQGGEAPEPAGVSAHDPYAGR